MSSSLISLRNYQKRIVNVAMTTNTVVLLPTGAGKTFIAAEVISRRRFPSGSRDIHHALLGLRRLSHIPSKTLTKAWTNFAKSYRYRVLNTRMIKSYEMVATKALAVELLLRCDFPSRQNVRILSHPANANLTWCMLRFFVGYMIESNVV